MSLTSRPYVNGAVETVRLFLQYIIPCVSVCVGGQGVEFDWVGAHMYVHVYPSLSPDMT